MAAEWEPRGEPCEMCRSRSHLGHVKSGKCSPPPCPRQAGNPARSHQGRPCAGARLLPGSRGKQPRILFGKQTTEQERLCDRSKNSPAFVSEPQTVTPSPATYQSFWKKERKCQPAYAPFSIKTPRFPDKPSNKEFFPGPGTYEIDKQLHKKITWPMKFGSPDWSSVLMPAKRMLKMEVQKLTIDREFRKHRDRVAYLSLYSS